MRYRNLFFYLTIFTFGAMAVGCGDAESAQEAPAQAADTQETPAPEPDSEPDSLILFFGNSLTAGYGLELSQAFPALIQQKIDSADLPYEVRNSGLSGETTAGGNSRVEFVLSTLRKPLAVFVLELGGNDGLRGIPPEESEKNLQAIIDKVRAYDSQARILLCGMEAPPNMGDAFTGAFREMYPALSEKNRVALVPFLLEGVGGEPELNLPDGIHPTPEGHQILARTVWKYLRPLLVGA